LRLSPDERLEKYVKEHDIVDIAAGPSRPFDPTQEDAEDDDDAEDESEGDEINDSTFPDCEQEEGIVLCQDVTASATANEATTVDNTASAFTYEHQDTAFEGFDATAEIAFDDQYDLGDRNVRLVTVIYAETGCDEPFTAVGPKSVPSVYETFNLADAWANGKIARQDFPLSHKSKKAFNIIRPTLTCSECCHVGSDHKQVLMVYDDDYIESIKSSDKWWDGVFIGSFAQMTSHYAHCTVTERAYWIQLLSRRYFMSLPRGEYSQRTS
jgi:hypothetical protein